MSRPKKISDEEVLDIARQCFLEKGPQVSTREIAAQTGLSQPALFKRFKTKEELFLAAIATKDTFAKSIKLITWLSMHPQKGPLQPQVEELMSTLWNLMLEILPRIIAMHSQRGNISPEKLFSMMKKPPPVKVLEGIASFVLRAQKNGQICPKLDSAALAMNIMGAIQGRVFFTRILSYPAFQSDNEYIAQTARNFCRGIANLESCE